MFFISIIAIFVSAFGVTTQATLYPGNKLNFALLRSILDKAYWPIYGEMKILDEIDDCPKKMVRMKTVLRQVASHLVI